VAVSEGAEATVAPAGAALLVAVSAAAPIAAQTAKAAKRDLAELGRPPGCVGSPPMRPVNAAHVRVGEEWAKSGE